MIALIAAVPHYRTTPNTSLMQKV